MISLPFVLILTQGWLFKWAEMQVSQKKSKVPHAICVVFLRIFLCAWGKGIS